MTVLCINQYGTIPFVLATGQQTWSPLRIVILFFLHYTLCCIYWGSTDWDGNSNDLVIMGQIPKIDFGGGFTYLVWGIAYSSPGGSFSLRLHPQGVVFGSQGILVIIYLPLPNGNYLPFPSIFFFMFYSTNSWTSWVSGEYLIAFPGCLYSLASSLPPTLSCGEQVALITWCSLSAGPWPWPEH